MTIQERLLAALETERGECLSGERLAQTLSVSRNAIWKAIEKLRSEGYPIEAAPRRGYRLSPRSERISPQSVGIDLKAPCRVETVESAESTNALVRARAAAGEAEGLVLIAREQTRGRGRRGRTFFSPPDTGLYMSILLRPRMAAADALFLTTRAAVAVAEAVEEIAGKAVSIKWVNDLLRNGRKIAGILTEASVDLEGGGLEYAVLGIGVNLREPVGGFPEELREIAGAVFSREETYPADAGSRLAAGILNRLFDEEKDILEKYRARSILSGQEIVLLPSGEPARALYVDEQFHLVVQTENGQIRALNSGEVSVRERREEKA